MAARRQTNSDCAHIMAFHSVTYDNWHDNWWYQLAFYQTYGYTGRYECSGGGNGYEGSGDDLVAAVYVMNSMHCVLYV